MLSINDYVLIKNKNKKIIKILKTTQLYKYNYINYRNGSSKQK